MLSMASLLATLCSKVELVAGMTAGDQAPHCTQIAASSISSLPSKHTRLWPLSQPGLLPHYMNCASHSSVQSLQRSASCRSHSLLQHTLCQVTTTMSTTSIPQLLTAGIAPRRINGPMSARSKVSAVVPCPFMHRPRAASVACLPCSLLSRGPAVNGRARRERPSCKAADLAGRFSSQCIACHAEGSSASGLQTPTAPKLETVQEDSECAPLLHADEN